VKPWLTDLDGACERSGDLPSFRSLPHYSERVETFRANATGQNGERAKIEPSFLQRIVNSFTRTNDDEVERLKKMLAEINEHE
jgi:hypothetical protein